MLHEGVSENCKTPGEEKNTFASCVTKSHTFHHLKEETSVAQPPESIIYFIYLKDKKKCVLDHENIHVTSTGASFKHVFLLLLYSTPPTFTISPFLVAFLPSEIKHTTFFFPPLPFSYTLI